MAKGHNYIAINSSVRAVDVAAILYFMMKKGFSKMSRGQIVKLAVRSLADQIRKDHPDLVPLTADQAHLMIEKLAPTQRRAIQFNAGGENFNDEGANDEELDSNA